MIKKMPNPITREDKYLYRIVTGCGEIPKFPITRKEVYYDKIIDQDKVIYCDTIMRNDKYLNRISRNVVNEDTFWKDLVEDNLTAVILDDVDAIEDYEFYLCKSLISAESLSALNIGIWAFENCSSLKSIDFKSVTTVGINAFYGCRSLTEVDLPQASDFGTRAFYDCASLKKITLPKANSISLAMFQDCTSLTMVDIPTATSIDNIAFSNCGSLVHLAIRNNEQVCSFKSTDAKNDPKNANLKIYVPRALLEDYKIAENWSRLADKFVALEDYTVDGTTTGELNI